MLFSCTFIVRILVITQLMMAVVMIVWMPTTAMTRGLTTQAAMVAVVKMIRPFT